MLCMNISREATTWPLQLHLATDCSYTSLLTVAAYKHFTSFAAATTHVFPLVSAIAHSAHAPAVLLRDQAHRLQPTRCYSLDTALAP